MKTIYSALLILALSSLAYSQATFQWSYIYDNSGLQDNLEKTVVDNQGNVFLIGNKSLTGGSYVPQPYIAKVSTGGSLQYSRTFTHPYANHVNTRGITFRSAAADNEGNIIVVGFIDSAFGNKKGLIVKYNSGGDTVWARYAGIGDTLRYCTWNDIKMDNSGNIYVTGANFSYVTPSFQGIVTAKYNSNGVLQWIRRYTPSVIYSADGYKNLIEIDNAGNVISSGSYQKTFSSNSYDMQVIKYSSTGNLLWAGSYNGVGDGSDVPSAMKLDAAGNVYLAGRSENLNSNQELACIKFNYSTGAVEWAYRTDGSSAGFEEAYAIDIKNGNEIYLCGALYNTSTYEDGILIKLNTAGQEQWRRTENTGIDTKFMDVKTDATGIYTLVRSISGPNYQVITRKYNSNGDTLWSTSYHVTGRAELAKFINVGPSNNLYVSGDENFVNNTGYVFLVRYIHYLTGVANISNNTPGKFLLHQNYPNPFNPVTNIKFEIPKTGLVKLTVFDITGKVIDRLVDGELSAGTYNADFNASSLSSGAYFYKLETEGFTDIKKMILVK